jgi:hypothetical protein
MFEAGWWKSLFLVPMSFPPQKSVVFSAGFFVALTGRKDGVK